MTLVQIIEIERRLEEQRITMHQMPCRGQTAIEEHFCEGRRQAGENIRLLVEKHQKELKSAMHAMGVAFLSRRFTNLDETAAQLGEGDGKAKRKKRKGKK